MAAVPMSYRATLYDIQNKRSFEVFLEGDAFLTGLTVGGGPLPPGPGGGGGGGSAPPPHPAHPIWNVPVDPGYGVPGPGPKPPEPIAPPVSWKAVWHPTEGWIVVGVINPEVPHPVPSGS